MSDTYYTCDSVSVIMGLRLLAKFRNYFHETIVALLLLEKLVVFVSRENSDILRCLSK